MSIGYIKFWFCKEGEISLVKKVQTLSLLAVFFGSPFSMHAPQLE